MRRKRRTTKRRPASRRTRVMTVRAPSRRRRVSRARSMVNLKDIGQLAIAAGINELVANTLTDLTKKYITAIDDEYHPAIAQFLIYYAGRRFKTMKDFDTVAIVKFASEISGLVQEKFLKSGGLGMQYNLNGVGEVPTASDVASLLQARNDVEMADRPYNLSGVGNVAEKYINSEFAL